MVYLEEPKANDNSITAKKSENLPEWYSQLVVKSGLIDYAPVKGSMAYRPGSYEIWEEVQKAFNAMLKSTGHRNMYLPLLIPERLLEVEGEHFEGFKPEVYWVTKSGNNDLSERLAIRPTSETIVYHFFTKWIRSWRDMPLLLNQWCSVLRSEIKDTRPFLRNSEFLWQEGHTAHETAEEAEKEVMLIANFYKEIMEEYLALPVLMGRKSEQEKFAGAVYTVTLEAIMPDGRALQSGTSHFLGQNFTKPFGVSFLDRNAKEQNPFTTSWGISTRLLGGLVMVHGDDKGLVLPPRVAPVEIVVVPIYRDETKGSVLSHSRKIRDSLVKKGFRAEIDDRDGYTPGWKFNEWELRGVPLRIEIGPKDMEQGQVTFSRRDQQEKHAVKVADVVKSARRELRSMQKSMLKKAKADLKARTFTARSYSQFKAQLEKKGFIRACWCGSDDCENKIKEETGATCRLIKIEREEPFSKCVYCNAEAKHVAYFAKSY